MDNGRDRIVPDSWRVLYHRDGGWETVQARGRYSVEKGTFNEVKFEPVETDRLRLEVRLQAGVSAGIFEWRVLE